MSTIEEQVASLRAMGPKVYNSAQGFLVSYRRGGWLEAIVSVEDGVTTAKIDGLYVQEHLEGRGLGTDLVRAFGRKCLQDGVAVVRGIITSPAALKIRSKVFGTESLRFYNPQVQDELLPMTVDQAYQCFDRLDQLAAEAEIRGEDQRGKGKIDEGILVVVALTDPRVQQTINAGS